MQPLLRPSEESEPTLYNFVRSSTPRGLYRLRKSLFSASLIGCDLVLAFRHQCETLLRPCDSDRDPSVTQTRTLVHPCEKEKDETLAAVNSPLGRHRWRILADRNSSADLREVSALCLESVNLRPLRYLRADSRPGLGG